MFWSYIVNVICLRSEVGNNYSPHKTHHQFFIQVESSSYSSGWQAPFAPFLSLHFFNFCNQKKYCKIINVAIFASKLSISSGEWSKCENINPNWFLAILQEDNIFIISISCEQYIFLKHFVFFNSFDLPFYIKCNERAKWTELKSKTSLKMEILFKLAVMLVTYANVWLFCIIWNFSASSRKRID